MKLILTAFLLVSFSAFAETTTGTKTTTTGTTTTGTLDTPTKACTTLIESATKKDFEAVQKLTLNAHGPHKGKMMPKHFEKMHKDHWAQLKELNCGTEIVTKDRAIIEAKTTEQSRLIPFVKTEEGWKFDAKTYMSFYGFGPDHKKGNKKE